MIHFGRTRIGETAGRGLLAVQAFGALAALVLLTFAPPVQGRILLVPLPGTAATSAADLVRGALPHGAIPVGAGPVAGSVVVEGRRAALMIPMLRHGVVAMAATPAGCLFPASSRKSTQ
jgi:hypothetical protein